MKNLLKDSKAYYEDNDYYEIFSIAEDAENKVANYLNNISKKKVVLDAGCGTGKFLRVLEDNSVDLVVSTWVLGTIMDIEERNNVLNELKRILKQDGQIILVENAENSEFEKVRGRDKDSRTTDYNDWILNNGFILYNTINTYFEFKSLDRAKKCFEIIYGNEIASRIVDNKIEHKINIYKYSMMKR